VEAVGRGVVGFTVGDEVYGMTGGVGELQGSVAEFAAADSRLLAIKPRALSMRQSASLPLAFITAWEGLVDRAGAHAEQRVLVHGGAGGIGHVAVQLARARGADVYATGSPANQDVIRTLGATPIDYTRPLWATTSRTLPAATGSMSSSTPSRRNPPSRR
jgi:NADPH:quinone reductase-like Zn-dependent oxidoreductase